MAESNATAAQTKGQYRLIKAMRHGRARQHLARITYRALIGPAGRRIKASYWLTRLS